MVKGIAGLLVDMKTRSLIVCAVDASFQTLSFVQRCGGMLKATFAEVITFILPRMMPVFNRRAHENRLVDPNQ